MVVGPNPVGVLRWDAAGHDEVRILVTGRDGQVARSLAEHAGQGRHDLVFAARPGFDLTDPDSIRRTIADVGPHLILSCAAYTAVDQAEDEPDAAMAINGEAPGIIGEAAAKLGAPVIHLSTDYVFDGSGTRPWREDDPVAPLGVYGWTKLAGERALAASGARWAVVRTAWVYSPFGHNFVKSMLRLAGSRDELGVVSDQHGNSTSAGEIARALLTMADRIDVADWNRVYHFAGTGDASWADFAEAVFKISAQAGGPSARVNRIETADFPTKARRPANSRLDCNAFTESFGFRAPEWRVSLEPVVRRLIAESGR
jgi:dTDP-4-dehydrorhamnose reductase